MESHTTEISQYDVIFIGSGIGSLAAASLLAQWEKKRCLIIEKHWQAGGYTHAFKRKKKYVWDVGLHYVGQVAEGEQIRRVFDVITQGKLQWNRMPDAFDKFVYPGKTFDHRTGIENYRADLEAMFPAEKDNIAGYFQDVDDVLIWFQRNEMGKNLPMLLKWLVPLIKKENPYALMTTRDYLAQRFDDEKLRAIVASQWGDYGLPPSQSAFCIHAILVNHFFNGAAYPVGSAEAIAENIIPIIEAAGGKVITSHAVEEIIVENGKATGVRVKNLRPAAAQTASVPAASPAAVVTAGSEGVTDATSEISAPIIISCAGAYNTYVKLLKTEETADFKQRIVDFNKRNPPVSHISVYLALKESPAKLGLKGENHWIYDSWDHEETFRRGTSWVKAGRPPMAYLSTPSLKDPKAEGHTAEIISFAPYGEYAEWKEQPWHKRDEAYKALKENAAQLLIAYVSERVPGFADLVDFYEISTPITTEYMTSHDQGAIYGLACVPERFDIDKSPWCQVHTPVKNLYLTGADSTSLGIAGAMMGGVATCAHIMKPWHLPKLLKLV
ncbi:phytoene desaturase family protein [Turneriella parva]|uniref:Phytoene dehydrogenase-like protein n=1 Tax=Turneriella parva (strain ATCC BAA-1111 / DSM 21527 / NCTC 11395 / H) TaxID=869212 RepID=I4B724_TURPD|nr:NAD(P)/FAD-dependent oxidoreductase [Turneriella parva]AFM13081.1 phytoene dehydrogenase-like protein [Turneriella parva DSM 21527]